MITWRMASASMRRSDPRRHLADEPVILTAQRYGFFPIRFCTRGATHQVVRIERVWEELGWGSRADRRCFAVRCADGRHCTLWQDLRTGTWFVRRSSR